MAEYVPENLSNKQDMFGKLLEEPNILEKIMTQVARLSSFCVRTELDPHLQCCHVPNPQWVQCYLLLYDKLQVPVIISDSCVMLHRKCCKVMLVLSYDPVTKVELYQQ